MSRIASKKMPREPRTLIGHAGFGAGAELEAQLAQPLAIHVAGGCSNAAVARAAPSERLPTS